MKEVERTIYLDRLDKGRDRTDVVKVITGMRRCGKSTLMRQYIERLKRTGVVPEQIVYFNFESEKTADIDDYSDLLKKIHGRVRTDVRTYIFLDEIQRIKEWERAVNSLLVDFDADVYITGSNAHFLSGNLATYLSGRYVEICMLPLSFKEYMELHGGNKEEMFRRYIKLGALPCLELDGSEEFDRQFLFGIFNTVLIKDVLGHIQSSKAHLLSDISRFLYDNVGNSTSCNKIAKTLDTENRDIRRFIDGLLNAFLFYKVERYDIRGLKLLDTQEKYYASDTGLRNVVLNNASWEDTGKMIENVVFLELKRRGYEIHVGKFGDSEVDFIAFKNGVTEYYQVTMNMNDPNTREREISPLMKIKDNHPKFVLSLDSFVAELPGGIIHENVISWLMEAGTKPSESVSVRPAMFRKEYVWRFSCDGTMYCYNPDELKGFYIDTSDVGFINSYYEFRGYGIRPMDNNCTKFFEERDPYIQKVVDGITHSYDDLHKVLETADSTIANSPVKISEEQSDDSGFKAKPKTYTFYGYTDESTCSFSGIPVNELACSYTRWNEDTLVTCDAPVVHCNLYAISKKHHLFSDVLEGYIYPLSPRTLFISFRLEDIDKFRNEFCDAPGRIDPMKVNRILAENAVELVFYKDSTNPVFEVLGRSPRSVTMVETTDDCLETVNNTMRTMGS